MGLSLYICTIHQFFRQFVQCFVKDFPVLCMDTRIICHQCHVRASCCLLDDDIAIVFIGTFACPIPGMLVENGTVTIICFERQIIDIILQDISGRCLILSSMEIRNDTAFHRLSIVTSNSFPIFMIDPGCTI